jgi:hypothetical protein
MSEHCVDQSSHLSDLRKNRYLRTKVALAAANARLVKVGRAKLAEARKAAVETIEAAADPHAANVLPIIREIRRPARHEAGVGTRLQ